jgi:hypothetical protein
MKFNKVIRKRIEHSKDGVNVAGAIDAAIAVNVNESGTSHSSVHSDTPIVQRSGKAKPDPNDETKQEGKQ